MRTLLLLLLTCISAAAMATGREPPVISEVLQNQTQIRSEAAAGKGRYKDMSARERDELVSRSTQLTQLIADKEWSDLSDAQQVEAFNLLGSIKATVDKAEDERLICEQKKKPGSNLTYKSCKTVAQLRRQKEDAEQALDKLSQCAGGCLRGN